METLVRQGKVIYVGSNFAGWNIAQAQETARARHFQGLVSEQSLYNLIERRIEMEVLPAAREYGLGLIPWSPLMRGALGGILRKEKEGRSASEQTQRLVEDTATRSSATRPSATRSAAIPLTSASPGC